MGLENKLSSAEYDFERGEKKGKLCKISKDSVLLILLISSVILGFFFGWLFGSMFDFTPEQIDYISFPGDIFMSMLKMMILPLIFSSLVSSLASLDSSMSGKLGVRVVVYYISTTIIAVFLGILLVLTIRPGEISGNVSKNTEEEQTLGTAYALMDLIRSMFPSNLVEATFRSYKTDVQEEPIEVLSSEDLSNVMLNSGVSIASSLVAINGSLLILGNKMVLFNSSRLSNSEVKSDMALFLQEVDSSLVMIDNVQKDLSPSTTALKLLISHTSAKSSLLQIQVDRLTTDPVSESEMDMLSNETTSLSTMLTSTTCEMVRLVGMSAASAETVEEAALAMSSALSGINQMFFMIDYNKINQIMIDMNDLSGELIDAIRKSDTNSSFVEINSIMTIMMNMTVTSMHILDIKSTLNLNDITMSLMRMTVDVLYSMDTKKLNSYEIVTEMNYILKRMNTIMVELSTLSAAPLTGDLDELNQIASLAKEIHKLSEMMAIIVTTGMDYVIFHRSNATVTTVYVGVMSDSINVLGIVVFAIAFGVSVARVGEDGRVVIQFFSATNEAIMKLVTVIMWYAPIGIFFLITGSMIEVKDWEEMFTKLAAYIATVVTGLAIHGFIILPLLYFAFTRKNPYRFLINVSSAFVTALGTASSSATLPVTIRCLEDKNSINKQITRFMLPIGATVNMDGTALYEAVAAIFIAQMNGIPLNVGQVITISLTSTFTSIGAAGIPDAGLVTMVTVLTAVNLPTNGIALILAVDFIVDRLRTVVNVEGDSIGAGIVDHLTQANESSAVHSNKDFEEIELQTGDEVNESAVHHVLLSQ
ncbi:excitatory amino acid transporter 3-like [Anneissia japonica]|uniref:excitatory amino acid transporter 3-like n=1 Tax=Anneissia japonica TaxID=1529436 RepID=UPI0014258F67|nr:excitatory amino acid transporter 3-like [Anneissia japonica]